MNIMISVIYGILGLIIGYKIPEFSLKIMEYKKGKSNAKNDGNPLYSNWFKLILSLANGVAWALAGLKLNNPIIVILVVTQITIGIIIAFIDVNIKIIPNELVLTLVILGITFQIASFGYKALITAIISMVVMMAVFISVAGFVGFGKVGAGDVKLAGVMGLSLGYPLIITAVFIMAIVLLVFIAAGMAMKKITLTTMLPLAPFMISGFVAALVSLLI